MRRSILPFSLVLTAACARGADQVKAFAEQVAQDHQQASQSLRQVATQQNVQVMPDNETVEDAREELADYVQTFRPSGE